MLVEPTSGMRAEILGGRKKNKQGKSEQTTSTIYTARHHLVGTEQDARNLVPRDHRTNPNSPESKNKTGGTKQIKLKTYFCFVLTIHQKQ